MTTTNEVTLGKSGPAVFPIALGCMGMGAGSWYGASNEAEAIATIHEAIERGVNVIDTGHIGLSEVGVETIRRAASVHPICDLQLEYALVSRNAEVSIIPALRELGIAMTAYGVLSRGLLTGAKPAGKGDIRAHLPRFSAGNAEQNEPLVDALARIAAEKGASAAQLAIAWVRAKAAAQNVTIIPTLGARTRKQLVDALSSLELALDAAAVAALEAALPATAIAGTRYGEAQMAMLDSEK